ncbi:MAG: hypothetical protein KKA35_08495 [Proteobacteria bacterium]|nr:hypothetical protein [Pseudomonadota bacterium]
MKKLLIPCFILCVACLLFPSAVMAGKGYMGGQGTVVVEEEPPPPPETTEESEGIPDTVEGPLNDKKSDSGKLFGDLYKILRQQGMVGDNKLVPEINATTGDPVISPMNPNGFFYFGIQEFVQNENIGEIGDPITGGEPVLTVINPPSSGDPINYGTYHDYGWYAAEIDVVDEIPVYGAAQSPYPAQCVQPVASYERWGDISSKTGLTKNRLPMVVTYDATWNRSECEVGQLDGEVNADPVTGELTMPVNQWFIEPCEKDENGNPIPSAQCQWTDPVNGLVTYPNGVLWIDLIGEVHFGRLNLSRSPEAVLQAAYDEAINNLNDPDTIAIEMDASGRLLLTKNVYDPLRVDPATGLPLLIGTVKKAIDSPLENMALYVKLMKDGHLVTPADERIPIDRSLRGGIPIWKMLELDDGPADAALRPTIDIQKLRSWGLGSLVDVSDVEYRTYYQCLDANGAITPCLCWDENPEQPELDRVLVACDNVVSRVLLSTTGDCPDSNDPTNPIFCEGPFIGLQTDGSYSPDATDLNFTASFLASAADKTGDISVDMVVYLNSILGINLVIGEGIDENGEIINYEKNPVYFNYLAVTGYDRKTTFTNRGQVVKPGGVVIPQLMTAKSLYWRAHRLPGKKPPLTSSAKMEINSCLSIISA